MSCLQRVVAFIVDIPSINDINLPKVKIISGTMVWYKAFGSSADMVTEHLLVHFLQPIDERKKLPTG